ncbi:MAG: DUF192 domain-containing protein [Ignavibacteria bacterium]|nr:DUF192 domain-containing protein [Ignavibacteria bacterium]
MTNSTIKNTKTKNSKKIYSILSAILVVCFIAAYVLAVIIPQNKENTDNTMETAKQAEKTRKVTFLTKDGNTVTTIEADLADTEEKRTLGLMFREKMDMNHGMLFIFPDMEIRSFWMKNTILPLDIIFINDKKEVVSIQKNAVPFSERSLPSKGPAQYVVEVNAGFTDQFNIKENDRLDF